VHSKQTAAQLKQTAAQLCVVVWLPHTKAGLKWYNEELPVLSIMITLDVTGNLWNREEQKQLSLCFTKL